MHAEGLRSVAENDVPDEKLCVDTFHKLMAQGDPGSNTVTVNPEDSQDSQDTHPRSMESRDYVIARCAINRFLIDVYGWNHLHKTDPYLLNRSVSFAFMQQTNYENTDMSFRAV